MIAIFKILLVKIYKCQIVNVEVGEVPDYSYQLCLLENVVASLGFKINLMLILSSALVFGS